MTVTVTGTASVASATLIRYMMSTAAGTIGTASTTAFNAPYGVAVDSLGNMYVADSGDLVIKKAIPAGVITTFSAAFASGPRGAATDFSDNVYGVDYSASGIRKINPTTGAMTLSRYGIWRGWR